MASKRFASMVFLLVLASFPFVGFVQASSEVWTQTYGNEKHETGHLLIETSDKGYIIGGYTREVDEGEENKDFLLIKNNSAGIMEWNQTYELKKYDSVGSVIQVFDGGYVIAGGLRDCWLIKTDSNGSIQWNMTYGSGKVAFLIQTADGGYAFCGNDKLMKTDSQGNLEWKRSYDGRAHGTFLSLVETSDGEFVLAGNIFSVNSSNPDFWLVKTDDLGNVEWTQTYEYVSGWWETAEFVHETLDAGYLIAGVVNFAPPLPISYFWIIKTDAYGNMDWNKTYAESEYEQANSVVLTSDGGLAIVGSKQFFDHGYHHDFWLIKTDSEGNEEWIQTYGVSDNEIAHAVIETSDGGYALTGESYPMFSDGDSDLLLIKTDETGNIPEFSSWTSLLFVVTFAGVLALVFRNKISTNL